MLWLNKTNEPSACGGDDVLLLEYADLDELLDNLNHEMSVVQDVMAEVSIAAATSYFAAADPTAWITEGTR